MKWRMKKLSFWSDTFDHNEKKLNFERNLWHKLVAPKAYLYYFQNAVGKKSNRYPLQCGQPVTFLQVFTKIDVDTLIWTNIKYFGD